MYRSGEEQLTTLQWFNLRAILYVFIFTYFPIILSKFVSFLFALRATFYDNKLVNE